MENDSNKKFEDKIFDLVKDDKVQSLLTKLVINMRWNMFGDIFISLICISGVIVCAKLDLIEKGNVSSLLSLIIGAVIGARFKSS